MPYKRIFIWVEGDDDERFFSNIIEPKLKSKYNDIKVVKWGKHKKEYIKKFIRSINSMKGGYIFVRDFDNASCIINRKEKTKECYQFLDENKIFIVVTEIEGWYLAGLNVESSEKLKIKNFKDTNDIVKEQFDELIPSKFDSRIDFMKEILKMFTIDIAKKKNNSFEYFCKKHFDTMN